jgi:hypothetical protein
MSKDDSSTESRWLVNNGDNWTDYKFLTMAYCGKHKCTGLLDGSLRRPVLPISTSASSDSSAADAKYLKDLEDYTTKSGNLWYYFACTHNDTTRVHIMDPGIGNDCTKAWAALCNHFESKTKASLKQLAREFVFAEQGSDPPEKFFQFVDERAARITTGLDERKMTFIELMKQVIYIDGLDSRYESTKSQLFHDNTITDSLVLKATLLERIQREDLHNKVKTGTALSVTPSGKKYCKVHNTDKHDDSECYSQHPELSKKAKGKQAKTTIKQLKKEIKNLKASKDDAPSSTKPNSRAWLVRVKDKLKTS